MSSTTVVGIKVDQGESVKLAVESLSIDVVEYLLGLTWYHNGSVVVPDDRITLINDNTSLTITDFSTDDTGIYEVQFNQLFVHSYDPDCNDELISLLRSYPVLKPAVFCINMESKCPPKDDSELWEISVQSVESDLQGTFHSVSLEAQGTLQSSKELEYSSIEWFRSGSRVTSSLSALEKQYLNLHQHLQQFNTSYEYSGRYEVLLTIDLDTFLRESTDCQPYYDRFVSPYLRREMTLAKGHIDIGYHKGMKNLQYACTIIVEIYVN